MRNAYQQWVIPFRFKGDAFDEHIFCLVLSFFVYSFFHCLFHPIYNPHKTNIMGSILTSETQGSTQNASSFVGDLRRCCCYAGGINDSCARRKSKMGWSEVATLVIGVVWA